MTKRKRAVVSKASPHTIKKFELIEEYIKSWAQKLMLQNSCNGLIYIDCMCNSGVYKSTSGETIEGSPVRVAKALLDVARTYTDKTVHLYFNDNDEAKVDELKKHLPANEGNFNIVTSVMDANELLTNIGGQLDGTGKLHYFLLYDPYDASIDWSALLPFFRHWGEVMINHMINDPVRAITSAKRQVTKEKYEGTYLDDFESLLPYGSNKEAYEQRVSEIIDTLKGDRKYFVAAFPFYNTQNSHMYDLIHCTSNREGFKLYKKCAWKVFGAQSSTKRVNNAGQLHFDMDGMISLETDESCFNVRDIAQYLQRAFDGRQQVPLEELWQLLENHPIFPSDGYRLEIKKELTESYGAKTQVVIDAATGKRTTVVNFTSWSRNIASEAEI